MHDWQEWNGLPEERRDVIRTWGWHYFYMPIWTIQTHREFPVELRSQVVAIVMAADQHLEKGTTLRTVLSVVTKALDERTRCML